MPPKASGMSTEEFLGACFKYCKEKPTVDFAALSSAINMSAGGAQNKFRALMKQFEDEGGAVWTKKADDSAADTPADPPKKSTAAKRKAPARKASKASVVDDASGDESADKQEENVDSDLDADVPKKKARTASKKVAAKTAVKGRGKGKKATPAPKAEEDVQDVVTSAANDEGMTEIKESIEAGEDVDADEVQV